MHAITSRIAPLIGVTLLGAALLAGCAPTAPAPSAAGDTSEGSPAASETTGGASGKDCSGATTAGYDFFVDPELQVQPELEVYPLQSESDKITFTYTGDMSGAPTFSWELSYIQPDGGEVSPQGGEFFEDEGGVFSLAGPRTTVGVDGGPYAGFLDVFVTSNASFDAETQKYTADTKTITRLCVLLAE